MFSKISRYRKLANIVTTDADGNRVESKDVRLSPEVSGIFSHTIEKNDRLDHLAYKYYKQPRKWWRICDANQDFMSPAALLGKNTIVTTRIPLNFVDHTAEPPWAELQQGISQMVGVQDLQIIEEQFLIEEEQLVNSTTVTVHVPRYTRALKIIHNTMNVSSDSLVETITTILTNAGFTTNVGVGQPQAIVRTGKKIIIPPDTIG